MGGKLLLFFQLIKLYEISLGILTPTPRPFMETTVSAANSVVITPITKAPGMTAKLKRFRK